MWSPTACHSKANKQSKLGERKVYFISDAGNWCWGVMNACPKADSPHGQLEGESFYRWKEGATCRNSIVTSDSFRLIISGLTSIILIVLGTVNLHFQGRFISISLRPVLRIVAVYVMGIREGNGTPLQYSCLENPMDGGAWWAAIHGVAEGRTWLSNFTFTFHFHALEKEMATHSSVLA